MVDAATAIDGGGGMLDSILDPSIKTVLAYGVLGVVSLLLAVSVVILAKKVISLFESRIGDAEARNEERIKDWRELSAAYQANTQAFGAWTASNEVRTRAIEASVAAQQASTVAIQNLVASIALLHEDHGKLHAALQSVREAILSKGGKL